jgi:hypothetical protein
LHVCREAIRYVRLREDFATASVQGRPLAAVFGGAEVPGQGVPGLARRG